MTKSLTTLAVIVLTTAATGQEILIDWRKKTGKPVCPARVDRAGAVSGEVQNINQYFYTYAVHGRLIANDINDLASLIGKETGKAVKNSQCSVIVSAASKFLQDWRGDPALNPVPAQGGQIRSIPLDETVGAWETLSRSENAVLLASPPAECATEPGVHVALGLIRAMNLAAKEPNSQPFTTPIKPDNELRILVIESYRGSQTNSAEYSCSPASGVLSFSGGLLVTGVANRTYERRLVPDPTATAGSTDQLVVANNSKVHPAGAVLLNYRMWDHKRAPIGLSLSSGPVFKFSGGQGSSNFGFFGGLSLRFHDRYLITPGIHLGEFADFPPGFSPGMTIPSNFGALTTVNRWTARFGLSFTYATPDFAKARKDIGTTSVVIGGLNPVPAKPANDPAAAGESVGNSTAGAGPPPPPVK